MINLSQSFIDRPVATTVLMVSLVIFGLVGYKYLPISDLPNIDFPTILVSANLPGADPETMASTVATPLEKQFSTIAGIESMSSVNNAGQTRITIQFVLERDIDAAAQDIQAAISQVIKQLPPQMPTPPSLRKVNPTLAPILILAIMAEHLPLSKLDDYAETYVAQSLSMISGVAEVNVYGSQQYAVRILVNPNKLVTIGLDLNDIASIIPKLNTNQPSGTLQSDGNYRLIKTDGQLNVAAEYNEAVLISNNNAIVRLKDVGTAIDSVANDKIATWYNNKRAIILAIQRQPGTNTVKIVKNILEALPVLLKKIPGDVKVATVYDRSVFIKDSIKDVEFNLIFAILLVLVVTYLFFNSVSSTLITALDFPTSIIATFAIMYLLNYSLDNLSLMALILAVGFVIDDTIVVLENILRHMEYGSDRFKAAINATSEISFTVLSMTLSLAAVFIPILFMGGLLGKLFHEFAVVVGSTILFSGFVALTLTPMLRSRFLSIGKMQDANWLVDHFSKAFERSKYLYINTLEWAINNSKIVWWLVFVILIMTIWLMYLIPKGFIPSQDSGIINAKTQIQEGLNFSEFIRRQQAVIDIIIKNPNVEAIISTVGQGSGGVTSSNGGQITLRLKPRSMRKQSADNIIQQLNQELRKAPGIKIFLLNPPSISIGGISSTGIYQYILQGPDWQHLKKFSKIFFDEVVKISGIQSVNSDLILNNPELHLHILRDRAAELNITPAQIESLLYSAYGSNQVTTIITPINQYQVILEVDPKYQKNINHLNMLYVRSPNGSMVPLNTLVQISERVGPLSVNHYSQLPAVTISFNIAPNASLGSITGQIENLSKTILPEDITGSFAGSAKSFKDSMITLPILLLFTILVIYVVLAILYEHFIHPITILTALPFAAFGALATLYIFGKELNIFSFIGIIMLVGLVKKNGIIMIDFALEEQRKRGLNPRDAIVTACKVRYRPIMMTTMAAILAAMPLAIGFGSGSESRQPMGLAVVGGLLFSQTLTLYVTPIFYLTMEKLYSKFVKI